MNNNFQEGNQNNRRRVVNRSSNSQGNSRGRLFRPQKRGSNNGNQSRTFGNKSKYKGNFRSNSRESFGKNNSISQNENGNAPRYLHKSTESWMNISKLPPYTQSNNNSKLKIYTLSGLQMVGTNCTAFEYGYDILFVDAGLGYPDEFLPGVDLLAPNIKYFKDKKDHIRGLLITHGHNDHIGAIHYIIEDFGFINIYAPRLACEMIKLKLTESGLQDKAKLFAIDGDSSYQLGVFQVNHFKMTHTIPDNYGIVLTTPVGRIVISSDYKFDSSPYKELPSEYSKLAKLGELGVLLLINESTNARKPGWSESESGIGRDIGNTIRDAKGRVIIGMFSTMVNRMRQIVEFSQMYNKKVAVLGKSLSNIVKITHGMGLIDVNNGIYIDPAQIGRYPDDQIVIIATGSQGEPNSALMKIAEDRHNRIQVKSTDTILFSSSRIPGNEGKIDRLIDLFSKKGITILTNDYLTLHASGHGHQEEHKLMIQLVRPKYIMPVHGDFTMRQALANTAYEIGYKQSDCIIAFDGAVTEIDENGFNIVGTIDSKPLWIEGNRVGKFNNSIVDERIKLQDEGIIVITIRYNNVSKYKSEDIEIVSKGFYIQEDDTYLSIELKNLLLEKLNSVLKDSEKSTIKQQLEQLCIESFKLKYEKEILILISVI